LNINKLQVKVIHEKYFLCEIITVHQVTATLFLKTLFNRELTKRLSTEILILPS